MLRLQPGYKAVQIPPKDWPSELCDLSPCGQLVSMSYHKLSFRLVDSYYETWSKKLQRCLKTKKSNSRNSVLKSTWANGSMVLWILAYFYSITLKIKMFHTEMHTYPLAANIYYFFREIIFIKFYTETNNQELKYSSHQLHTYWYKEQLYFSEQV